MDFEVDAHGEPQSLEAMPACRALGGTAVVSGPRANPRPCPGQGMRDAIAAAVAGRLDRYALYTHRDELDALGAALRALKARPGRLARGLGGAVRRTHARVWGSSV